jgi:outer membrane protein TolC
LAEARAIYFRYKSRTDLQDLRLTLDYYLRDSDADRYGAALRFFIPNPFVDKHVLRTGEAAQREREASAEALKREITLMVYGLAQEIVSEERALSVLHAREQVLTDWAAHLKARQDARVATSADVLSLDLQRLRLKAAIQQKRLAAQAARRSLHVLTQIPDGLLKLDPTPPDWQAVLATFADKPKLIETALARSAELAVAQAAYDRARATLDTAKARQIPWFAYVQAGYRTSDSGSSSDELRTRLAINLPVFEWMSSEKKMAEAEMEAAVLRAEGIRQRILNETLGHLDNLHETFDLLNDYRTTLDAIPEPTRDASPDAETFYRLSDARLSATEYAIQTELHCALIYGQLLNAVDGM